MLNLFEKFAPIWRQSVTKYARAVWHNGVTEKVDREYNKRALYFSREYRYALESHYAKKGMNVYKGTLDGYVHEWRKEQEALKATLKVIADDKKNALVEKEIERLQKTEDPQEMINKLYSAKENETVYKVFSFKDNLEALAKQRGDENAFNLGTKINEGIISQFSDRYFWRTQHDARVRDTHMQLADKCFLFADPPTTVDKYGREHTGNPGTDFNCVPSGTRIRLNSDVIRCFRRKYTGKLTSFVTESGISFSSTGNHPILTQSGWKPANLVQVGDYVVKVPDKCVEATKSDIYDTGIPVEQVFDFFSLCGDKVSVSGGASQFHGDGIPQEEVDVVTVDWCLTDKRDAFTGEKISKLVFTNPDMMPGHLFGASESELNATAFRLGLSTFGNMRGGSDFHSLLGRGVLKADDIGLASVSSVETPRNDKTLDESACDGVSEIVTGAGNSTHTLAITLDDLVFERVTTVNVIVFDGHVYNLQTSTNWYIANGLSIHNCRCWADPADEKEKVKRGFIVYERK